LKYVYLCYFKLTQTAFQSYLEDPAIISGWMEKARELCEKRGVRLLILGSPYGLAEQLVVGVETDADVEEFTKLKTELYKIDTCFIDYSKTTIIIQSLAAST
jgi:hypothetical protein